MKRGIILLAFSSLLLAGCSSGNSSTHSAKGESGLLSKVTKAFKDGAKHRETTFKAEKKSTKDCIDVDYLTKQDTKDTQVASRSTMFKLKVKKKADEEVRNSASMDYYSSNTKSAQGITPCEE